MKLPFSTRSVGAILPWQRSEDAVEQQDPYVTRIKSLVYQAAWYILVYSFVGWVWEVFYAILERHRFENRGFLFGPLCPIYGVMLVLIISFYHYCKKNWIVFFFASATVVTLTELITGTFIEYYFGRRLWSYIGWPLNVKGYICIPVSVFWGLGAVMVVKFIHPRVHKLVSKIPKENGKVILYAIFFLIAVDLALTITISLGFRPYHQISEFLVRNLRLGA